MRDVKAIQTKLFSLDILIGFCLFMGLCVGKLWFRQASVDELTWLLRPVVWCLKWFLYGTFAYVDGKGFVSDSLGILIHKGCSGFHFLCISLALAYFLSFPLPSKKRGKLWILLIATFSAYLLTILSNTTRILSGVAWLRLQTNMPSLQSFHFAHEMIGVVVYLSALILFSIGLQRFDDANRNHQSA